ncbi:MAG: NUDIX hydrolase [Salipiger marinus]|uniref:NUDIX hydrolase n=1 Tax=Salipiger marinus TaxID=555512 RepID=UPI00405A39AF
MTFTFALRTHAPQAASPLLQCAALCYRIRGSKLQLLLITSRSGRRWTLPKGWPMPGRSMAESAAREAWEEAGVRGRLQGGCAGSYIYRKRHSPHPHMAMVFPLEVTGLDKRFPERGQRKRRWLSRRRAAALVHEPDLARLLLQFDPDELGSTPILTFGPHSPDQGGPSGFSS